MDEKSEGPMLPPPPQTVIDADIAALIGAKEIMLHRLRSELQVQARRIMELELQVAKLMGNGKDPDAPNA
jgi:hypothetical protein